MTPENDPVLTILLAIIIIIFAVVFLVGITVKLKEFSQALNYINIEIGRTTGEIRRYWKRENAAYGCHCCHFIEDKVKFPFIGEFCKNS